MNNLEIWIAIYLPALAVEVFHPNWLSPKPLVICEAQAVCAMSPAARQAGIRIAMRRSSIALLCDYAHIEQRDQAKENAAVQQVAMCLLQYSPLVTRCPDHPNIVLIEVAASLRLFGGLRRLHRRITRDVASMGFSAATGIATNANAAALLAQQRTGKTRRLHLCLHGSALARHLDPLPIALLPSASAWLGWLTGIGCQQLGQVRALPRAGLQRRCGKALLQALDYAYGDSRELHTWLSVPTQFQARCELPDRIENTDTIFYFARTLLLQLCGWLCKQQLAVNQIELYLEHERGRLAIPATQLTIHLASATWHEEHLSRLLKENLAHCPLTAAAIALRLHAPQVEVMQAPNAQLFPEPSGKPEDQARLLELLTARLGTENVLQAAPHADHRPEVANHWISAMKKAKKPSQQADGNPRPTWLLNEAKALKLRQHSPYYGSKLTLLSPAERIEAGWWNGQLVTRDYFIAECVKHLRYWIYRERIGHAQQAGDEDEVWYLHGVFG